MEVDKKYVPGLDHVYDSFLAEFKRQSGILSPSGTDTRYDLGDYSSIDTLQRLILQFEGDGSGYFFHAESNENRQCRLRGLRQEIGELQNKFEVIKAQKAQEGHKVPEVMDDDMHQRFMELQARLTITKLELEVFKSRLVEAKKVEQKEKAMLVLKRGCEGSACRENGIRIIDGQRCSVSRKGVPYISEISSPYCGMSMRDYREHVCKPWLRQRDRLKATQRKEIKAGVRSPDRYHSHARPPIPEWPSGIKNHLEDEKK